MNNSIASTTAVFILLVYICYVGLYSKSYLSIQESTHVFKKHFLFTAFLAAIGVLLFIFKDKSFQFSGLYLLMPLCYIILLVLFSKFSISYLGRPMIAAHKFNMMHEETADAKFFDYFSFILIHLFPIIIPLIIYESILGNKI